MSREYEKKSYEMSVTVAPDMLTARKASGSDWCHLEMRTHGEDNGRFTIRGREMAEALRLMLDQMLKEE